MVNQILFGELLDSWVERQGFKSPIEGDRMRIMLRSIFAKYNFVNVLMSILKKEYNLHSTHDDFTVIIDRQFELYMRSLHFLTFGYSDFALSALRMIRTTGIKSPWRDQDNIQMHPGYMVREGLNINDINNLVSQLNTSRVLLTNSITREECEITTIIDLETYSQTRCLSSRMACKKFVGRNIAKIMSINSTRAVKNLMVNAILPIATKIAYEGMLGSFLKFSSHCNSVLLADASISITLPSTDFNSNEASAQAIMWHSDWHGSSFLKIFIPLVDLCADTGSHAYLRNTHIAKPSCYQDRRYYDVEINEANAQGIVTHSAKVCDVIYEDTTGLHKGVPGHEGVRAILTLVFQNHYVIDTSIQNRHTHIIKLN